MLKKSNPAPTGNRPAPTPNPPRPPIDGCTESHCPRCRTHPAHRGDMEHAGIGDRPSAVEASAMNGVEELEFAKAMAICKEMFRAGFRSGMSVSAASQVGKLPPPAGNTPRAPLYSAMDRLIGLMLEVVPAMKRTGMAVTLCADVEAAVEAARAELCGGNRENGKPEALGWSARRYMALETLKSVLSDPIGTVGAGVSDADRALIAGALKVLTQPVIANSDPGATASAGAILTNPHTGQPRDYRDVESDPEGRLIVKPGEPLLAASTTAAAQEAAGLDSYDDALDQLWKLAGGNDHPVYKRFLEFRETFAAPVTVSPADLIERCREILAWQRTGVLPGDALRAYANARWPDEHDPLQIAEKETAREAFRILAMDTVESTPAAPGIDLVRVQAALKYAEAAARHNTHTELAADFADLIRRIDASPKGAHCATCNGHGAVGGLLPAGGGYESEPCPDCSGPSIARQFDRAVLEPMRQEAKAASPNAGSEARDAARYRFLRDVAHPDSDDGIAVTIQKQDSWGNWRDMHLHGAELDVQTDAAMQAQAGDAEVKA